MPDGSSQLACSSALVESMEAADGRPSCSLGPGAPCSENSSWSFSSLDPATEGSVLLLKLFNDLSFEPCLPERPPAHHTAISSGIVET